MRKNIDYIIKNSIDLHYHIGPEIIPRSFNCVKDLITNQVGKIKGLALKNHFYGTVPFINEVKEKMGMILIGSVTLNNFAGGLNPECIYAAKLISKRPIIVWFPTIDAKNFLDKSTYEIPWEWVQKKEFKARKVNSINGIAVLDKYGKINTISLKILQVVKKTKSILATGHLSWLESKRLIEEALRIGIKKIIVTHPIYQRINMPIEEQINLAKKGCFIEICYSMYSIDKISLNKITRQINEIGYKNIIISSDVGQPFSLNPDKALKKFANLLFNEGISIKKLNYMLVKNPKKIIFD